MKKISFLIFLFFLFITTAFSQEKVTLSGIVKDQKSNETLIGVTISFQNNTTTRTSLTNEYGFYSISLPKGEYRIEINSLSFDGFSEVITLESNTKKDLFLIEKSNEIEQVVVAGNSKKLQIDKPEMSVNKLTIAQIKSMPAILGEVDVIKSILTLPGVTNAGEGQSGFNVRGGAADQNLILLDEATIYNSSHLFGFFSTFNTDALKNVTDPEAKRKIIGKIFIKIFERESKKFKKIKYLAQGTLYPDVIESQSHHGGPSSVIKSHHNVGGLPKKMKFKLVEPFRELFKDEVRKIGLSLKLSKEIVFRHPFPGPGLAIRIPGKVDNIKVKILQEADIIFINELKKRNLYKKIWQAFTVLLPVKTVGVMGDSKTYEFVCSLRAVTSQDGMTADFYNFKNKDLAEISNKIINNVKGINRVVYDITSKPPATIEWE